MSSLHTKRAAAAGLAGALALGTIASVGALSPASAAEGTTTYNCTLSISPAPVPMQITGSAALPSSVESGQSLAGFPVTMGVELPATLVQGISTLLPGLASIGGSTEPLEMAFGGAGSLMTGPVSIPQTAPTGTGNLILAGTGKTAAGKAPAPGVYNVLMPKSFTFNPVGNSTIVGEQKLPTFPCSTSAPAKLGTVTVTKATSKVVTKVTNAPVTTAKRAKVLVRVKSTATNTGKVLIKKGKTVLAKGSLTGGKKVLTLTKLGKGTHKLVAIYKGDANTKASKKAFDLVVKRG